MVARVTHRPVLDRQLLQVIAGRPLLAVNACRRVKGDVGAQMAEGILKAQRHKNRVAGVKFPTAQDRATLRFLLQGQEGIQGVTDAGEGQGIIDGVNDPRRGGPAVEESHLMGLQQRGRMASGAALFLDQPGFLIA